MPMVKPCCFRCASKSPKGKAVGSIHGLGVTGKVLFKQGEVVLGLGQDGITHGQGFGLAGLQRLGIQFQGLEDPDPGQEFGRGRLFSESQVADFEKWAIAPWIKSGVKSG